MMGKGQLDGRDLTRRHLLKMGGAAVAGTALSGLSNFQATPASAHDALGQLALTPPMGWNSWNQFDKYIDEELIRAIADAMVDSGMKAVGYEYVVVDAGWLEPERDGSGNLQGSRTKFPSGMKALADYVHSRGLRLGLHLPVGMANFTWETPGTQSAPDATYAEKAQRDANTLASWGVDYLKFDRLRFEYPAGADLAENERSEKAAFAAMRAALNNTGRPIVYSINTGGGAGNPFYTDIEPWTWAPDMGVNLWRIQPDIKPVWSTGKPLRGGGVIEQIDANRLLGGTGVAPYAGPGHWNDPDMLEVGVNVPAYPGLTIEESRSHFSMWAMLAAPLMAAADLRNMSDTTRAILTNEEVIAVDQDVAGIQGERIRADGDQEVWVKPLADGDRAVVLFNRGAQTATMSTNAEEIGMRDAPIYLVRDLWEHTLRPSKGGISASVPSHGVAMFRVRAEGQANRPA